MYQKINFFEVTDWDVLSQTGACSGRNLLTLMSARYMNAVQMKNNYHVAAFVMRCTVKKIRFRDPDVSEEETAKMLEKQKGNLMRKKREYEES